MKKRYSLLVDEDIVFFHEISLNDDGSAKNQRAASKVFAYENKPTIVHVSSINEIPSAGDIYDPLIEGFPFIRNSSEPLNVFSGYGKFALVVDEVVHVVIAFDLSTELGSKMNAVFLSNPTFLEPEFVE